MEPKKYKPLNIVTVSSNSDTLWIKESHVLDAGKEL